MLHDRSDDTARRERRALRSCFVRTRVGVIGGVPLGTLLIVPGFVDELRRSSPPVVASNLDAFLTPLCAWLVAAALVGIVVSSGEGVRASSQESQFKATRFCVVVGLLLGVGLYGVVASGLPMLSRHRMFPSGVPLDRLLEVHPFLLTSPELFGVQASFRRLGGFSSRVALTLELRLWLSISIPALALVAAVGMLMDRPRSRFLRVLAVESIAFCFLLLATIVTIGPAVFLRPFRQPFNVAWVIVGAMAVASYWWLRRRLASPRTAPGLPSLRESESAPIPLPLEHGTTADTIER